MRDRRTAIARRAVAVGCLAAVGVYTAQVAEAASSWHVSVAGATTGHAQSLSAATPSNVTSACVSPTTKSVTVSWAAISHARFIVYWSNTSSTSGFAQVASGVTGTSWTSGALSNGTYWFEIAASYGGSWTSSRSASTASRQISNQTPCS